MEATICNFRRGRHIPSGNQMILRLEGVENREQAHKLLGKTVVWKTVTGKEISGKITKLHGNTGAVRALFETGMPGQSLGTKIKIL